MSKIIAVAQQKGGAGKTMLATQIGVALAQISFGKSGHIALLDIDPQGSLAAWGRLRTASPRAKAALTVESVSGWRLGKTLDALSAAHALIVIDTPPVLDADARRAIRAADLVLVPLNPAAPDLWAAEGTLKLAAEEHRRIALVFNRAPAASRLRKRMEAEITGRGLILLPALGNRVAYANAFAEGLGVTEAAPATQAATELRMLAEAVMASIS
jgi:chromosome partitioning protein